MSVGVACDRAANVAGSTVRGPQCMGLERYSETDDFLHETSSEKQNKAPLKLTFFRP